MVKVIAYVIYGGGGTTLNLASLTSTQGFQILGAVAGDKLGASVSYAGDINNDGKPDIILGAPGASPSSGTAAGSSYVIYGKSGGYGTIDLSTLSTTQGFKIIGAAANDGLGNAVSSTGDINGDNIDDFLIAASGFDSSSRTDAGAVYVIFGMNRTFSDIAAVSINITQGFKIFGAAASDKLGQAVNYAGDINQDGYKDILVRAPLSTNTGAMYLVYGGPISYMYWDGTYLPSCNPPFTRKVVSGSGVANCNSPCTSSSDYLYWDGTCSSCPSPLSPQLYKNKNFCVYPCTNSSLYLYQNGTCSSCDPPYTPRVTQGKNFCVFTCTNPSDYLYWDETCSSCASPLVPQIENGERYCNYPCTSSADSLYWDGSCSPCDSPLLPQVYKGKNFCDYPCTDSMQYLYWDGDCSSSCNSPLLPQVSHGKKFCDYRCTDPAQYLYWDGNCSSCNLPLLPRQTRGKNFCDYPCTNSSDFLYWDGDCISSCDSPLLPQVSHGKNFCNYTCTGTDSLYWDGTCGPCDFPLGSQVYKGKSFCTYSCTNETDYLYWDGTCNSTCNAPFAARFENGKNFCDYPCTNPSDHLYWDGSCSPFCDPPLSLRIFKGEVFCDFPCANTSDFLYWNGSCIPSYCPAPLVIQPVAGDKICNTPCSNTSLYYYIESQSCHEECPKPYYSLAMDYGNACTDSASPQDIEIVQNILRNMNIVARVSENGLAILSLVFPGLSAATTAASLARLIDYTRYLNITSSPRLKVLHQNINPNYRISYVPRVPPHVRDTYNYHLVQPTFSRYYVSASFLVNYWNPLIATAMVLTIFSLILGLEQLTRIWPRQNALCKSIPWIRIVAQNFIFTQLYATLGELFLFTFLEIHTHIHSENHSNLSLAISIICLLCAVGVLVFHFLLLRKFQKAQGSDTDCRRAEKTTEFKLRYAGFKVFYDDFKETNFFSQAFLLFSMLREILFQLILVALIPFTFLQIVLNVSLSIAMLAYLFKRKPYKQMPQLLLAITLEFVLLIVNISLFEVEILDISRIDLTYIHYYLGETIIYSSLICYYIAAVFIGVKVIWEINQNWRSIKTLYLKGLIAMRTTIANAKKNAKKMNTIRKIKTAIAKKVTTIKRRAKPKKIKGVQAPASPEIDRLMNTESPPTGGNVQTLPDTETPVTQVINIEASPKNSETAKRLESPFSSVVGATFSPAHRTPHVAKDSKANYIQSKVINQDEDIDKIEVVRQSSFEEKEVGEKKGQQNSVVLSLAMLGKIKDIITEEDTERKALQTVRVNKYSTLNKTTQSLE